MHKLQNVPHNHHTTQQIQTQLRQKSSPKITHEMIEVNSLFSHLVCMR